eukprot:767239-Hanusia_phi.AAC.1
MQDRLSRSATLSQQETVQRDPFIKQILSTMTAKRNADMRRLVAAANDVPKGEHDLVDIGLREESRRKLEDEVLMNLYSRICQAPAIRRSHAEGQRRVFSARQRDELRREHARRFMKLTVSPKKGSRPWTGKERPASGAITMAKMDQLVFYKSKHHIANELEDLISKDASLDVSRGVRQSLRLLIESRTQISRLWTDVCGSDIGNMDFIMKSASLLRRTIDRSLQLDSRSPVPSVERDMPQEGKWTLRYEISDDDLQQLQRQEAISSAKSPSVDLDYVDKHQCFEEISNHPKYESEGEAQVHPKAQIFELLQEEFYADSEIRSQPSNERSIGRRSLRMGSIILRKPLQETQIYLMTNFEKNVFKLQGHARRWLRKRRYREQLKVQHSKLKELIRIRTVDHMVMIRSQEDQYKIWKYRIRMFGCKESIEKANLYEAVRMLQSAIRSHIARKLIKALPKAALVIQRCYRRWIGMRASAAQRHHRALKRLGANHKKLISQWMVACECATDELDVLRKYTTLERKIMLCRKEMELQNQKSEELFRRKALQCKQEIIQRNPLAGWVPQTGKIDGKTFYFNTSTFEIRYTHPHQEAIEDAWAALKMRIDSQQGPRRSALIAELESLKQEYGAVFVDVERLLDKQSPLMLDRTLSK